MKTIRFSSVGYTTGNLRLRALRSRLLPVSLLLLFLPIAAKAQFVCATNDGTITILKYTGTSNSVMIPNTIGGFPVTAIGTRACLQIL
jgi:hypothetical protein